MAIFNDGDPIDAAQLNNLQTQINNIVGQIPQIGTSVTNAANNAVATLVTPQIWAGVSGDVKAEPKKAKPVTLNYKAAGLKSAPKAILLTPVHSGTSGLASIQCWVVENSVTADSAQAMVFIPSGYTAFTMKLYFVVVLHN